MQQPQGTLPSQQMLNLNLSTEQIQKYLDENKNLIMAILDNQNLGKFAECASYQTQLQQNLTYLARIADNLPQATTVPSQLCPQPSQPSAQQEQYVQQPQAAMSQQAVYFSSRPPFQLNDQPQQLPPHLQQHFNQGQMRMRPGAPDQDTE
ncbi:hypothetical protein Tsubulata_006161 [Turnera subulata]|uniref:SS18 N-terminal domain-containing protein n=1 Tax=Turnera subulata TaxID=218843 RepID=A0A9Q0FQU6_9ROSI|nr:hypothetical protein Tsubulata_006161 [Turnera subulata]